MQQVSYLGFTIDKDGLRKNASNIESVLNAPVPQNVSEVKAFVGMMNFHSIFIPNFAHKMEPLYKLLRKDSNFRQDSQAMNAYDLLRREITSEQVLAHFDRNKPIVLTTDASDTAVAGISSHEFPNGELKSIAFVS